MRRVALLLALGTLAPAAAPRETRAGEPREIVLDRDDIDVAESVVVRPGVYRVADRNGDGVLRVRRAGVSVGLEGVTLDGSAEGQEPDAFDGVGVSVEGAEGVTIHGGAVRGFRVGLRAARSPRLTLVRLDASGNRKQRLKSTPEREDASDWLWPHENDAGEWERSYGAGISLTESPRSSVSECRVRGGQNGLLLTRCDESAAFDNDFSFDSGWGIALYRSNRCEIARNSCDWCVRGYSHGVYARGQDSAGILVFEQCSDNLFAYNSATHSGDGFFLYAGNETLQETGKGGSNRNRLYGNDFSHAVANAIEATFSEQNEFVGNLLDDSDHGLWAGYSRATLVRGNTIRGCANGVSIEHGSRNRIEGNAISDCRTGVHLWAHPDARLEKGIYGTTQETASRANLLQGNVVENAGVAVWLDRDVGSSVLANRIARSRVTLRLASTREIRVAGNDVAGPGVPVIRLEGGGPLASIEPNWWGAKGVLPSLDSDGEIGFKVSNPLDSPPPIAAPDTRPPAVPARGTRSALLAQNALRGRRHILVDEWGPIDPSKPTVFPRTQSAVGHAQIHVLGAGVPWKVTSLTEGFLADPAEGTAPATLRVRAKSRAHVPTFAPFEARIRVGEADSLATGTVFSARWKVRWWPWTKDPREDPAAFSALVAAAPRASVETDAIDFAWGGDAPHPAVPADRFATVATSTMTLPAGRWRVRTVSDDGVRVRIDGKVALEDWTWHAPKEDTAVVELTEGPHEVVVEHFELDGWAALRLTVEPVIDGR